MLTKTNPAALLFATLETIILDNVPVMTDDRQIGRKNQAALARQLFKSLGLKGISVRTPSYSMASVVEVSLPTLERAADDYLMDGRDWKFESWSDMPIDLPARVKNAARYEAEKKVGAILAIAFPNHDDRSDSQSDYFDNCWSIN